ncbi:PREDICTED: exosome complex component RRP45-like isoform X2 [Priapulus caudatus]|nr:PREDICTED: exosome complex component RRP45-like isoform X2 [Priapulus caudatus]XP_014674717.1 PREDICTED: exosome complex component RRP45-like isoform X2 [Priapulus caudatus]
MNVELSPMACPSFEAGKQSDYGVEVNRALERLLRDSLCIDLESLCIMSGEKVWQIRVDVHVLNHDGNLIDCSSIAAIAALSHFRRPDVTVSGEEVTIHPLDEKDAVPLSVNHIPLSVTFAFFDQGRTLLVDPTDQEERVMDGKMVVGINKHRELCMLHVSGKMLVLQDQVVRCVNIAAARVGEITDLIKDTLEKDNAARKSGKEFGFAKCLADVILGVDDLLKHYVDSMSVDTTSVGQTAKTVVDADGNRVQMEVDNAETGNVSIKVPGTGKMSTNTEGGAVTWCEGEESDSDVILLDKNDSTSSEVSSKQVSAVVELSDSEEESVLMTSQDLERTELSKSRAIETRENRGGRCRGKSFGGRNRGKRGRGNGQRYF